MCQSFVSISNKMEGVAQMDLSGRNLQQSASALDLLSSREYIASACISENQPIFRVVLENLLNEERKGGKKKIWQNQMLHCCILFGLVWFGFCLFLFVFCKEKETSFFKISHNMHHHPSPHTHPFTP